MRANPAPHSGGGNGSDMNVIHTHTVVHTEKERGGGKIIERQSSSFRI